MYILLKEFQSKGESTILWGSFLRGSRGAAGGWTPLLIQISLKLHNKITKNLPQTLWQTQITVGPHPRKIFLDPRMLRGKYKDLSPRKYNFTACVISIQVSCKYSKFLRTGTYNSIWPGS